MNRPLFFDARPEFMIFAHRGGCGLGPENTLETAGRGLENGAFAWELDVGLTKDGVALIMHDDTLDRTTNARKVFGGIRRHRLKNHTWQEISSLDAGAWWKPRGPYEAVPGARVPTLKEALDFTRERGWRVNVEIKNLKGEPGDKMIAGMVVDHIREADLVSRCLVSSFQHEYLAQVRKLEPAQATGALVEAMPADPARLLMELGAQSLHPKWKASRVKRLEELAGEGMIILPWTVNRPRDMNLARRSGLAGIFTDSPDLAKEIAEKEA